MHDYIREQIKIFVIILKNEMRFKNLEIKGNNQNQRIRQQIKIRR